MTRSSFIGTLLITVLAAVPPVCARADEDQEQARRLVETGDILPLEVILEKHRATAPGDILEIELEAEHGVLVYEIEWLDADGQVWKWQIDARSGERIGQEKD